MIFNGPIVMIDFQRKLKDRKRNVCGPYQWTPRDVTTSKIGAKDRGIGFYMASKGFEMDRHGSAIRLRVEMANDHLGRSRLADIDGYYTDDFEQDTLQPIIARLPHGRGFLAGWMMGAGMCANLNLYMWDDIESCARAAHSIAENDAEREREYQARENERIAEEERLAEEKEQAENDAWELANQDTGANS